MILGFLSGLLFVMAAGGLAFVILLAINYDPDEDCE